MDGESPAAGGLSAGSRVAGYLLQEQIGRGGMAVVFRALDERLDRTVALKVLAPALAADEAFRQRFIRESRAAAAVDDPHIIPVFEAGESSGVLFIAMRFVRAGDVGTMVRQEGPLPVSRVVAMISPVASALDAAHQAGLVHRDVKPANMLLDVWPGRPEHVYLSDFGLSKGVLAGRGLTGTGQFLGTLDYVAPEQIQGGPVDGRADQYSLASTAFELLTGAPPFHREETPAMMFAHLSQPPPAVTSRRPDLPPAVDAVFARALAKGPADRYPTCREFAEALRESCGIGRYDSGPGAARGDVRPPTEVVSMRSGTVADASGPATEERTSAGRAGTGAGGAGAGAQTAFLGPRSPQAESYRRRPQGRKVLWAGAAVVVVLALAATAAVTLNRPQASARKSAGQHRSAAHGVTCLKAPSPRLANWSAAGQGRPLLTLGTRRANVVEGMAFSPDGASLAVGTFGGSAYLVDVASGSITQTFTDPGSMGVEAVAFSCDGTLAVADVNGAAYLWNTAPGAKAGPAASLPDPAGKEFRAVAFSPDGTMVAAGDSAGNTYLWEVRGRSAPVATLEDKAAVQAVAFSPDGKTLAAGDAVGDTNLWPVGPGVQGTPAATLSDPASQAVQAVAFSPDGTVLATGDAAGGTYLWHIRSGPQATLAASLADPGPVGRYGTVAVAFSRTTLAAGGYTGQTYLWDPAAGRLIGQLADPGSGSLDVQAVAFSPDGATLATGDTSGGSYLWTAG